MRAFAAGLALVLLSGEAVTAGKLDVAYASMEQMIVTTFLTDDGRRYLQGGPEDTCAYAFIQEPRVSAMGQRLQLRFLFAGRAGKQVGRKCVGAGDNFDIIVSGVPRYADGDVFLDEAKFEADHKLFDVFSKLIERQLAPLLRIRARPPIESHVAQLTSRGAGTVRLESMDIQSIELGASSAVIEADFLVTVKP
ncbi:MAG: hypothetical protein BMS9Abin37_1105 [Acidobacteriota bacterium]|nr:MAG: hypothetical protein BMS9Abin37_1105 [Acidobacteriota bacterium]